MHRSTISIAVILLTAVAVSAAYIDDVDDLGSQNERIQGYERRELQPSENTISEKVLPEVQNYDTAVAQPHRVCIGVGWRRWCVGIKFGGKRRSIDAESSSVVEVLGSEIELKLYSSYSDVKKLRETPVVRAELYERPLANSASATVQGVLGGKQLGVVVTVEDGRRFLLVKGNQEGRGKETVAIISDHMTDDWVKVATKQVTGTTFGNFVQAGGRAYDLFKDNGNQAAERMMELE
jgi:hypothetical protein